jgi:hypothetical protein
MYAIKLNKGVYHQVAGWVTSASVPFSQATLHTTAKEAYDVIKRHGLQFGWFPQVVRVSL